MPRGGDARLLGQDAAASSSTAVRGSVAHEGSGSQGGAGTQGPSACSTFEFTPFQEGRAQAWHGLSTTRSEGPVDTQRQHA